MIPTRALTMHTRPLTSVLQTLALAGCPNGITTLTSSQTGKQNADPGVIIAANVTCPFENGPLVGLTTLLCRHCLHLVCCQNLEFKFNSKIMLREYVAITLHSGYQLYAGATELVFLPGLLHCPFQ